MFSNLTVMYQGHIVLLRETNEGCGTIAEYACWVKAYDISLIWTETLKSLPSFGIFIATALCGIRQSIIDLSHNGSHNRNAHTAANYRYLRRMCPLFDRSLFKTSERRWLGSRMHQNEECNIGCSLRINSACSFPTLLGSSRTEKVIILEDELYVHVWVRKGWSGRNCICEATLCRKSTNSTPK